MTTRQIHLTMLSVSGHATTGRPKAQCLPSFGTMICSYLTDSEDRHSTGFLYRHFYQAEISVEKIPGIQKHQAWIAPGPSTCAEPLEIWTSEDVERRNRASGLGLGFAMVADWGPETEWFCGRAPMNMSSLFPFNRFILYRFCNTLFLVCLAGQMSSWSVIFYMFKCSGMWRV
jgi:hypothetical protein